MQGNNNTGQTPGQGGTTNNNGQKSGLSWSQPASGGATPPLMPVQNKPASAPVQQKSTSPAKVVSPDPAATKRLGMIAGGVVVAAILIFAWVMWGGGTSGTATDTRSGEITTTTTQEGGSSMTAGENTLVPVSPQDAGLEVAISSATVSVPTWVVVYESVNGEPGRALGATLFFPATNGKSGTVSLLRATEPGQSYLIGENTDSGDRVFALHGDEPVVDLAGQPVWYTFTTK